MRGGERVLERLLGLHPGADIFTHVYDPARVSARIRQANVKTSLINRMPLSRRFYQYYLPLMPMALEELDLSAYDLVISSESGPAKGVITQPSSLHLCYCHSPMRYLMYHRLRNWDVSSSARVDRFAANSSFIQSRIAKVWRRSAEVIHPPVDTSLFTPSLETDDYYLWVGQMVPYKRPDLAVDAFNQNGLKLLMVGTGSMVKKLRARAGPNITIVERMDFTSLRKAYARAKAFVMTAEEDFGIAPVEAMASGRPVVAYGRGGVLDSVVPDSTGIFFDKPETHSLVEAVERMNRFLPHFDPRASIRQASCFAPNVFDQKMQEFTRL
jgi:glycosyltransferase involved in cell wall biosynthesis